jgi:hypothetical protein
MPRKKTTVKKSSPRKTMSAIKKKSVLSNPEAQEEHIKNPSTDSETAGKGIRRLGGKIVG